MIKPSRVVWGQAAPQRPPTDAASPSQRLFLSPAPKLRHPLPTHTLRPTSLQELLTPLVTDTDISMEISGFAALALGLVFTSTCKEVRGAEGAS